MGLQAFIDTILKIVTVVLMIAVPVMGLFLRDRDRRMERVETEKADRGEVDELRGDVKSLAEDVRKGNDATHQINVAIARLTEQMARVVSDIESEKGTIKRQNERVLSTLDELSRQQQAIARAMERIADRLGTGRQS